MIDRLMLRHGFTLTRENIFGAEYQRPYDGHIHVIDICYDRNGDHYLRSYDMRRFPTDSDGFISKVKEIPIPVLLLCYLKAQKLKFKYKWRKGCFL